MSNFEKIYKDLGAFDVSKEVKELSKKQDGKPLKYLSWAKMVEILNSKYPSWSFKIHEFDENGIELENGHGFIYQKIVTDTLVTEKKEVGKDGNGNPIYATLPMFNPVTGDLVYAKSCLGYNVKTSITIDDVTKEMWLYAMDSHSKPCKDKSYMVYPKYGDGYTIPALSSDILNKSIMRCLVKNAAMFGLGLNLYNGEDLPAVDDEEAYSEVEGSSAKPIVESQKKQQPVQEAPKKVEPQPKFKPTATAKVEPVKQPVATPVQPTNVPKVNKVNAAEPVAKIPEMEQDTSLMNLNDALNTRAGNRTFQFYIDAGGVGLTPEQQKNSKARLISFSSRNDDIGKAARTILTALEKGECSFKQA